MPIRQALGPRRSRTHPLPFSLPGYTAVVYRGRFHRLETAGDPSPGFGRIEGFWGYLQRQLRAKGGVRRERLPLYIAEYVWRYNHRDDTTPMFQTFLGRVEKAAPDGSPS